MTSRSETTSKTRMRPASERHGEPSATPGCAVEGGWGRGGIYRAGMPKKPSKDKDDSPGPCRTLSFDRALDRYEDIAARHPEARLWRIRAVVPGLPRRVCLSPYHIAQAYLQSIPEHYRRSTGP